MFRRRSRSFSRFRGRFKRRRRSLYPHQSGGWQRAQFHVQAAHLSSDDFSDIVWSEILGISEHIGSYTVPQGDLLNQIARYVEVRAIRCEVSGYYFPTASAEGVTYQNRCFAGIAIDTFNRDVTSDGSPESAVLFDPWFIERPIRAITATGITTESTDISQPTRWLKTAWQMFNGGNIANAARDFGSNQSVFRRSWTYAKRFRLDDHHKLYFVSAYSSNALEAAGGTAYTYAFSGALWYRVGFGR